MADGEGAGGSDDPFEGWNFDEQFVADAARREESAEERVARLSRIEREHRAIVDERERERRRLRRQARRGRWKRHSGRLVVIGILLVVAVAFVNQIRNQGPGSSDVAAGAVVEGGQPPRSTEAQDEPIGEPEPHPASEAYEFMATQADSDEPVAYDPCRPLHVVVNARTQPPGGDVALAEALERVRRATGLQIVVDGPTDEVADNQRKAYQPDRYPDRWAPVLVEWTDPETNADVVGYIAGTGGSQSLAGPDGIVYVTGEVQLDGPQLAELLALPDGHAQARAIIIHELGHLLGLDHVADERQLMYPEGSAVTELAAGDLSGLARLGRGRCFPEL